MNTKQTIAAALASMLVTCAGATAGSDLTLARSYELMNNASRYDSLLNETNLADLKVSVQIQSRYQFNSRDDAGTTLASPDDDITTGFLIRRAKVGIEGKVTDNMSGKIKFAFDRKSGVGKLEDAYGKWKINDDITLKFGQFKPTLLREENLSSSRQLASERSAMNETYNQDFSQGVELNFGGDRWRAMVGINDGFNNDNTAFNGATEADFALTTRAEFRVGDADWNAFKQFTSFRGSASGGLIGGAVHYQSMGDTNPAFTPTTDMTVGTIDFSWVDDGWNMYAAGVWRNTDTGVAEFDDFGVVVQGGVFLGNQDEIFARWDEVFPDDANGATNGDFSRITVGWNHYMVPESHAAKFTLDLGYALDSTSDSIVKTSDGHNLLADSEDGQISVTAQLQLLF
jgi:Phosphate-selective porin O and P